MTDQADTIIPTPSQRTPQCPSCGFAVQKHGQLCATCKDKADARPPVPMWQIRPPESPEAVGSLPRDGQPERDSDADDFEEEG